MNISRAARARNRAPAPKPPKPREACATVIPSRKAPTSMIRATLRTEATEPRASGVLRLRGVDAAKGRTSRRAALERSFLNARSALRVAPRALQGKAGRRPREPVWRWPAEKPAENRKRDA